MDSTLYHNFADFMPNLYPPLPPSPLDSPRVQQSDSLASSYADIGITVETIDPRTIELAPTPSTADSFPHTPANPLPIVAHTPAIHPDFQYHSDPTDSQSVSSPCSSLSSTGLVKRSKPRSLSSHRGRPVFRRDSRPPNLDLPSGSTRRELSPLDIPYHLPSGPLTEPILNESSFDWSSPTNPALLSPPHSSTFTRQRSASCRSLRPASISGRPGSTQDAYLTVPDHKATRRRRSTSAPSEPPPNFSANVQALYDIQRQGSSVSQPRSPVTGPSSLTTSPSVTSVEEPYDPGSGSLSSFQLPAPEDGIYELPSYQPSPEFPLQVLEMNTLNLYNHPNSSASSLTSLNSQASPSSQPYVENLLLSADNMVFDVNAENLPPMPSLTHTAEGVPFHDNNTGGPSISITDTDATVPLTGIYDPTNDFAFWSEPSVSINPSILSNINDPPVNGGQLPVLFGVPFSSIETAADPATPETLPYSTSSPGSEQSFHSFESSSPTVPGYGNLPMASSSLAVPTMFDNLGNNETQSDNSSQAETHGIQYTNSDGQQLPSGPHPSIPGIAVQGVEGSQNEPPAVSRRFRLNVPQFLRSSVSTPQLGTYFHRVQGPSAAEGPTYPPSRASHHSGSIARPNIAVGPFFGTGDIAALHASQQFAHFHRPPTSPGTHSSVSVREGSFPLRPSQVCDDNDFDPHFQAKKTVYHILVDSKKKDEAIAKIAEYVKKMKSDVIRTVFNEAAERHVKSTPAGQQRAKDRRLRLPLFSCILCQGKFTTNNNLQNHYRSHLEFDQYRCPRCGDYFRTEGIRKRHTDGAQKCRRLEES